MDTNTKEINSITFGLYSSDEIIKMSVCKIESPKKTGYGSVYDERMGTCDSSKVCETCNESVDVCPGHFGHIEFNEPIIHPLYYKRVISFLNCFCLKCHRLLILNDQVYLAGLNRYKGESRFTKIQEKLKKVDICCHIECGSDQPKCKFSASDCSVLKVYEGKDKLKTSIVLGIDEIIKIFDNIPLNDIELLGFNPSDVHPKNLIIKSLPVLPTCARPYVKADGHICDDDLTNQYLEIIKINNHLGEKDLTETKKQKFTASLRFRVLTTFNNGQGKAKHTTNGRAVKGMKERLAGKEGQLRSHLLGKRSVKFDCNILEYSGKLKMAQDIIVGDIVVGDDGSPRTVINTVCGQSKMYTVLQRDGDEYGISCEHILTLKCSGHGDISWIGKENVYIIKWYDRNTNTFKFKKSYVTSTKKESYQILLNFRRQNINTDSIIDIHVNDYLKLSSVDRNKFLGVKLNVPIQWRKKPVQMDPRILGMWLSNGGSYKGNFISSDEILVEYFNNYIKKQGVNMLLLLKRMSLIYNKHIPDEYIVNNEETRMLVLAGFIDTSAYIENEKVIVIYKSIYDKPIIDGIQRICRSLGLSAEIDYMGMYFKLKIYGSTVDKIPTLLNRKKCNRTVLNGYQINVVNAGIGTFYGFEVDRNNRFLLGDYTITHNCNQTGRTVIGPDATLKFGQIALPLEMAAVLTTPVRVAAFNINILQKLVDGGTVDSLLKPDGKTRINLKRFMRGTRLMDGDTIIRGDNRIKVTTGKEFVLNGDKVERAGIEVEKLIPMGRSYKLELGWIVERHLQDGDYVLLNRQPTLHKASMLAVQIVIRNNKTIRMNLAITKPFNADFDGDEMNIHVPQSLESQVELKLLSAAQWNIVSAQSSKPNIAIVQDSLLGGYRMTRGVQSITKGQFFNIIHKLELSPPGVIQENPLDRIQHIRQVLKYKGKKIQCFTGKGIISMFLPKDFIYEKKNDVDPNEPIVKIWKGVLYEGTLNKENLGSSHCSLIHIINKEYGPEAASHFIDCIQFSTNEWNLINIFTVGLGDCLVTNKQKEQEIQDVIKKCYIEAEGIKSTTSHSGIREMRVNATLSKAKDIGLRIAKESLGDDNNFLSTVKSGSKGDFFNIAQITGLLGQQNLKGQRVPMFLNHGRRTLPHYPFSEMTPEMEYESRGFVSSSFIHGLSPREFYFHAMSGREGISDTAMGTATSGYMQRRIIKLTEDIKVQYDGTVRDVPGNIFQISYGEYGLDPTCTVKVNNEQQPCNISRMVDRLNLQYEQEQKKNKRKIIL
jgi:DNA-directed RNA polymerase beta' subunit